jgi:D-alanyl-D-alanine carboxypeptidase/D-alanyl-D-alanine-endopeptidase (penicillin-binding protein 4)
MPRVHRRPVSFLLLCLLALAAAAASPAADGPLAPRLARALAVPHVAPASTAGVAVDLGTGAIVFADNAAAPLAPASTEKLAVTYALLASLGPAFRIYTEVLGHGTQVGSTWRGDLVLKGYGDPSLASAGLARLAARVRAAGISRVTGSVVGDESYFDAARTAPGWKPSFAGEESPPLSALSVDRGLFHGALAVRPDLAAARLLVEALRAAGVAVAGAPRTGVAAAADPVLARLASPPLAAVVRAMDGESDNFAAELLLKHLGALDGMRGTTAAGAAAVRMLLANAGVPLAGVRIVDGSGLSLRDRLTAQALVAILEASWLDPDIRPTLVAALPVAGVSGTLETRMRTAPARGNVIAKTGTTDEASALAGFVRGRYAFAVLQNGNPLDATWARTAQDRFASLLAAQ